MILNRSDKQSFSYQRNDSLDNFDKNNSFFY